MPSRYEKFASTLLIAALIAMAGKAAAQNEPFLAQKIKLQSLRLAIEDLNLSFPNNYPKAKEFLDKLNKIEQQLVKITSSQDYDSADQVTLKFELLYRDALIANPLISNQPILFVVRKQYKRDHHNTATMFQTGEINTKSFEGGGAIKIIDFANGGKTKTILNVPNGIARDPEIHFDGKRIIFSMRTDIKDDYHIYEMNTDGSDLKQLTHGSGISDIDPLYMPDETIVFSSTREPKFCMCNRHIMANLYRMEADGANIHQIGKNTLHEGHPSVMPDGRILYDRWEYVDRNFGDAQGLWTMNPDGTNHAIYWGNNTPSPGGVIDARIIPGTQKVLCILGSCHDRPWGALAIIDRRLGLDGPKPVLKIWPTDAAKLILTDKNGKWDNFMKVKNKYEDPYPLNDKYFLCSRMTGDHEQTGIYLVDIFGNELLLHTEEPGCFDPMPIAPRQRPMQVPPRRDFESKTGLIYVYDVYQGTHMHGVKRGTIKYLRVIESPEKRSWINKYWDGQGKQAPGMNWHGFENKRILGTVPVENDGSAYFAVPSEKFIYFQLLDADGMMVQSMRSGTTVQPGERTGCVGCHDNRLAASPPIKTQTPLAMRKSPSKLTGWYGPPRKFNYVAEVQPVFDKYCVSCHDYDKKAGKKLNLAADRTPYFNTSYTELWMKKYIKSIGGGPAQIQPAYSWGSHASMIVQKIRNGHKEIKLDTESFDRLVTWIDINGPYYPHYETAYPENVAGRSPLDPNQTRRLEQLTGVPVGRLNRHRQHIGPQISFERPELSPCLDKFTDHSDPNYIEAVAIIKTGAQTLKDRPRADMTGFVACKPDRQRQQKYAARQQIESKNRDAICNGIKIYDAP